jgi:5,10-methylenetetrahydromethanopterin reductase
VFLIEHFCIWGGPVRWRERLGWLEELGCDGVMFILGQADQATAVREIGGRLAELGLLESAPAQPSG